MSDRIKRFWNDETSTSSVEPALLGFAVLWFLSFVEALGANTLNPSEQFHASQTI